MVTPVDPLTAKAQEIASANLEAILRVRDVKPADLAKAAKSSNSLTKKTVYNVLNKANPPKIQTLTAIADGLGIPVWALLVEGLDKHPELLKPGALKGLAALVGHYLECTPEKRRDIEEVARSSAIVSRLQNI